MGPILQLNYNLMDMKNVFIGDKDCYEVIKLLLGEQMIS